MITVDDVNNYLCICDGCYKIVVDEKDRSLKEFQEWVKRIGWIRKHKMHKFARPRNGGWHFCLECWTQRHPEYQPIFPPEEQPPVKYLGGRKRGEKPE